MIIYLVKNLSNHKIYIGKTMLSLRARRRNHLKAATRTNQAFHKAIIKYGKLNFRWYILDSSAKNDFELCELEKHYISFFKSQNKTLYNMTNGGDGLAGRVSPMKGKHHSVETKAKIGAANKGNIAWNIGISTPQTQASKDKISNTLKGRVPWNKGLKTGCFRNKGIL